MKTFLRTILLVLFTDLTIANSTKAVTAKPHSLRTSSFDTLTKNDLANEDFASSTLLNFIQ